MKDKRSSDALLREIFSDLVTDEVKRDSVRLMLETAQVTRRRRRQMASVGGGLALAAFFVLLFIRSEPAKPDSSAGATMATNGDPELVPGTPIRVLSDEDLFSLFPNRPVAVVTVHERSWFQVLE